MRESFPDAPSALMRAREVMRDLADLASAPWPQLEPVTTAQQYTHTLRSFGTARMVANREPRIFPFLDELVHREVITFDAVQPKFWLKANLRLSPGLADLWPLPEGVTVSLTTIPPFGTLDSEPEDDCTEEELDRMVAVLGPLMLTASWLCGWRGLPEFKGCGVKICLNSVWTEQHAEPSPGAFGVWIALGARVAWTPEGEAWLRDCELPLGEPQAG
ncbi:hypothetical protein RKE30_04195 [Streptomyces sp. Li-HN-5-11]|uniref:hypothetical protein n=1 Tax=Streptomyces sp. Li-HN-5-11 TaxID=3075432 RepID=UPI0028ABAA48|nr:hypothetical protein [Streptomyces sp. Li-HN-5-11]WNM29652.1 hypothetical protein RKE30_04195 [Streptomyces sp. Li-HN-5-11]